VLVRDRFCCVAGQVFEPWKASADGFIVRCHLVGLRQAIDATSRALCAPFMEGTGGHSRLTMASRNRSSAALSRPRRVVPKLAINRRCLRQASAPGWPKAGPESGESPAVRVSRHVGSGGVADQGQGSMSFSRRVLHMDPCPWPAPRQGCRRDGIPTYAFSCLATGRHTSHVRRSCLVPLACPFPRGLTGNHGH
jgi:hypothetical protein